MIKSKLHGENGLDKTYKVEEIFHDIPDDPDNMLMSIPPEICEELGWKPGDTLEWKLEGEVLVMNKKEEDVKG